jgi:WD40 repeat protein
MAIADDNGVVTVVDVSTGSKQPKRPKQLTGVHTSIVSAISFHPQRSDEIVTGGFDCIVCSWDLSSGRSKSAINVSQLSSLGSAGGVGQIVNPPFVQAVEYVAEGAGVAVALGDGSVSLFKHMNVSNSNYFS